MDSSSILAKKPQNNTSLQYTGRLQVKFMVQIRQLQIEHEDAHYASALFRYLKELAVILSGFSWLVFLDDKHRCKVGEPGFPVAAVDRGRSVLVSQEESFVKQIMILRKLVLFLVLQCYVIFHLI